MQDLFEVSGLPLQFDQESCRICTSPEMRFESEVIVKLSELNAILLNKSLKYPEKAYRQYHNLINGKPSNPNVSYDVIVLPMGLFGIEFVKTHIYFSDQRDGGYDSMIEILSGELTVLIQKNREKSDSFQFETYVDEVGIFNLKKGERLSIPTGFYYTFFNTSSAPVVFAKIASISQMHVNYAVLRREKSLAYFLISKNAKVEVVANPKYKIDCSIKFYSSKKINEDEAVDESHSFYDESKTQGHEFIFEEKFVEDSIYSTAN